MHGSKAADFTEALQAEVWDRKECPYCPSPTSTLAVKGITGQTTDKRLKPSDDPNDPLNWPTFKKWSTFAALIFAVTLTGVGAFTSARGQYTIANETISLAGPLLSPATLVIADEFSLSLAKAGQATVGWQIFGVAVSSTSGIYCYEADLVRGKVSVPLWGPIMNKIGRRVRSNTQILLTLTDHLAISYPTCLAEPSCSLADASSLLPSQILL